LVNKELETLPDDVQFVLKFFSGFSEEQRVELKSHALQYLSNYFAQLPEDQQNALMDKVQEFLPPSEESEVYSWKINQK